MEIIRGRNNLKPTQRGAVVTIGNFDGVHLGHQAILSRVRDKSDELGVPSMLICFEPQPQEFFRTFNAPARLTRFREKMELLAAHGVDLVLCVKFDEETRTMSADGFIDILANDIGTSALFVGDDFRFGADRTGDFDRLKAAGEANGFPVTNMYTLSHDDLRVSSTRIRECLQAGDFELAEQLLGRPYWIVGRVVYGRQIGRTLGVPTANIELHRHRAPIDGVYTVETEIDNVVYHGVANVGVRPTLEETTPKPILEVHLFDFSGEIYGQYLRVVFRTKLREEKKFDGLEELKAAIFQDISRARDFFS